MKKLIIMSCAFVFGLSVAGFAQPSKEDMKKMQKERQEMTQLVEKYNKATSDKKKAEIKEKIQAKVAANYDKHIERMEERLKDSQKKLDEAKAKLAESKTPEYKAKHIDEITEGIISGKHKPMFGVPPGHFKDGPKGIKGAHKNWPAMKGHKGCPFAKGQNKGEKGCPFMKDGAKGHDKNHKDCPCKKGPKAEILPVEPQVEAK